MTIPTPIDLSCKLLCASEAAYCIATTATSGRYNPCNMNMKVDDCMLLQYNAVKFIGDPFVITASPVKIDPYIKIEACLVGETTEGIVLSFRGTLLPALTVDSIADWIEDIFYADTVSYLPNTIGKVHEGFLMAFKKLENGIIDALKVLNPNNAKPLFITGHSKGGGMAPIAAMYLREKYKITAKQVVTFAGPKPGDVVFCEAYDKAFTNDVKYENYLDIVPLLPPSKEFIKILDEFDYLPQILKDLFAKAEKWNYGTVGKLQYIDSTGTVDDSPAWDDVKVRLGEIFYQIVFGKGHLTAIGDAHHASCGYRYMQGTCKGNVCVTAACSYPKKSS